MFSLLVGAGVLFLAVFVSVILDPRPTSRDAAEDHALTTDETTLPI